MTRVRVGSTGKLLNTYKHYIFYLYTYVDDGVERDREREREKCFLISN